MLSLAILMIFILSLTSQVEGFQISGGVDARYTNTNGNENDLKLEGLFLNFRKVFSDKTGDRFIAVGQLDMDDNFKKIRPYQIYLQYKGPLGKWNIRAGHYILPFGLLSDYDTERLVLKTIEDLSIGIKLDTGIELFGYIKDFDYVVSLSQGTGRNRFTDIDDDKLITIRIGWQGDDISIGISGLIGRVLTDKNSIIYKDVNSDSFYENRLGLDITKYIGPLILRGELFVGKDNNETVEGILLKGDYTLSPNLELNLKYAYWQREDGRNFIGAGGSYELFKGLFLRIADEYQFGKEGKNVATGQIYYEFVRSL